tara:strand:- start:423 stop:998 length:576 start_codon:yes stop_codon:yes gene_type:complete
MKSLKKNQKKLWSLNISTEFKNLDKSILEYFKICEEKLGIVPNILKTNAINKKRFDAFNIFYNRIMQDDNYLTKVEKEMIAVVVSSINRCLYCCVSHSYNLFKLTKDKTFSKDMLINFNAVAMPKKHKVMLDFVKKITENSYLINDTDRDALRKVKFKEVEILEIIEVAAFFNMTNRLASGTNMTPNEEYY